MVRLPNLNLNEYDTRLLQFRQRLYASAPDVLVQVHIPKCAGTSVAAWLQASYTWAEFSGYLSCYAGHNLDPQAFPNALRSPRLAVVSGHDFRRFPSSVDGRRLHYFTILRRPIAQLLSLARYVAQERSVFGVPESVSSETSAIVAWLLERPRGLPPCDNMQTNHLALAAWCDAGRTRPDPKRYPFWPAAELQAYARERLGVAKDVLRTFLAVGTVERLAETLDVVRTRAADFGFHLMPVESVPHINVTRVPAGDLAWLERGALGEHARAAVADDEDLYAFADRLLAEALTLDLELAS